jgi:hypothetical protein
MQDEIEGSFLNKHFIQYCPLSQWSQNEQVDGIIWVWPICCLPSLTVLIQNQATTFLFIYFFIESYSCNKITMTCLNSLIFQ